MCGCKSKLLLVSVTLVTFAVSPQFAFTKVVQLDEVTPQGMLHLPPLYTHTPVGRNSSDCDYLVRSFSPGDDNHKGFGISVGVMGMQLKMGDLIQLSAFGSNSPPRSWNRNHTVSYSTTVKLEFKRKSREICIKLVGDWKRSKSRADLLLTLYFDGEDGDVGEDPKNETTCPSGMIQCNCFRGGDDDDDDKVDSSEEIVEVGGMKRCIFDDLVCNGVSNCGVGCNYDESERGGCRRSTGQGYVKETCAWTDFEYLIMMVLTGFLLILIPVVFLLTMMYHRRSNNNSSNGGSNNNYRECDSNNNVGRCGRHHHVISRLPIYVDEPPSYEDLPDHLKLPPRPLQGQEELGGNT